MKEGRRWILQWNSTEGVASTRFCSAPAPPPPAYTDDAYLLKVRAAGGFRAYERAHLNAIAAAFAAKLPLPPELVRRVVEYAFHVGDY